jgi:serine protease Do
MIKNIDKNRTGLKVFIFYLFVLVAVAWGVMQAGGGAAWAQTSSIVPGAPGSFSDLVEKVSDSVVNISTVKIVKGRDFRMFRHPFGGDDPFNDLFERFFKDQIPREHRQRSLGSGFVIDTKGYIITNNHVVEKTDEIKVILANDKEYDAEIIGKDPKTDLALIKIDADAPLKPLPLGDSDALKVGDWVVAIGNPFGLEHTVTAGIVSAKYRRIYPEYGRKEMGSYANFIQTDASINPGNSGGPLLNTKGEVVGINSAIYSQTGGSIGIGFAVPVNLAKDLLPQLKEGKVVRGWLGVMIQHITPELQDKLGLKEKKGALVADVSPGGPAEKAGIKRGDVIVSYAGKEVHEMDELPLMVGTTPVGKEVAVEIIRDGREKTIEVTIGELEEGAETKQGPVESKTDLGMRVEELTPEMAQRFNIPDKSGLVVVEVAGNSPAAEAGIRPGDLIVEIEQKEIKTLEEYQDIIDGYGEDDTILFLIRRAGNTLYVTLKVWE